MNVHAWTLLAVGLPANPTTLDLLKFSLTGIFVVLLSLSLLAVSCTAMGYTLRMLAPRPRPIRGTPRRGAPLSEETVAVIAAAVAEVIGTPHRIVRIRGLTPEDLSWPLEGRMQHHASHRPRQNR
jgi:Na+-transporting methylmalonyl-CoA/oxaloacetate decarboxylase gamma subunit